MRSTCLFLVIAFFVISPASVRVVLSQATDDQDLPQVRPETTVAPSVRFEQPSFGQAATQVFDILQDRHGSMWFGDLWSGLFKYDGYGVSRFINDPDDPASLSSNRVRSLIEADDGSIWVATYGGGLNRYDATTGIFERFTHDPGDDETIGSDNVRAILEDRTGYIWVASAAGLDRIDPTTRSFEHFRHDPDDEASISSDDVATLLEDADGTIWVGAWGLNRFDRRTSTFTHYLPDPSRPVNVVGPVDKAGNWVHSMHEDTDGRLWVSTTGGTLYEFDKATGTFERQNFRTGRNPFREPGRGLSTRSGGDASASIESMTDDPAGGLWLSTGDGLAWFDPTTGVSTLFRHDELDRYSIAGDIIGTTYFDRQGVMWVTSIFSGVNRFDRAARPFENFYRRPNDPSSIQLGEYGTLAIADGPDGTLWITSGGWLNALDRRTQDVTAYRGILGNPNTMNAGFSVLVEDSGRLWTGGVGNVRRMEVDAPGRFVGFRHDPADTTGLPGGGEVRSIFQDSAGRIWFGLSNYGLALLQDPDNGVFKGYPIEENIGWVSYIYEDRGGMLWLGVQGGLFRFDPRSREYERFDVRDEESDQTEQLLVFGICERQQEPGVIWFALYGSGLYRFDTRSGGYTYRTSQNSGLADNGVQGVLCDDGGSVWVSTDAGLSRYDPDSGTFKNFDQDDGLQGRTFNSWAFHTSKYTGEMFFGGRLGVNAFYPDAVGDNPNPPEVVLKDMKLFGVPVDVGGASPLNRLIAETDSVILRFDQNDVAFDYVGIHLANPEGNEYAYMLSPYHDDWRYVGEQRTANFTNLDPGEYTFRVKAANSDGIWNEQGAALHLTILPPWWRTTWAYIAYGLLLVGLVYTASRIQRRRLVRLEREKAAIAEAELRAEAAEAEARALEADNERKRNVELLGDIGREITSSLDIDTIFDKLYVHVNELMSADSFGVGLYHPERNELEYRLAIENGQRYAPYVRDTRNENQFPVWCLRNRAPVFINDAENEFHKYVTEWDDAPTLLRDGSLSAPPNSLIYLPLISGDRVLGVITTQSFQKDAYTEYDLNILATLASYTSIALDNADAYRRLGTTLETVKSMQAQLVTQEKLASLGQLTAGIAHEINNPLNFVNNFAEVNRELMQDLRSAVRERDFDRAEVEALIEDLSQNGLLIEEHGRRAKGIVESMMQHASEGSSSASVTDINRLVGEHIDLVYHGKVAQVEGVSINITRDFEAGAGSSLIVASDIGRVLLNLFGNAVDAVVERAAQEDGNYRPSIRVTTRKIPGQVEIGIEDNGNGIPADIREKIFEPFFTTKPTGTGTGLGLSLSHEIVTQAHGGALTVDSEPGRGARFVVTLNTVMVKQKRP